MKNISSLHNFQIFNWTTNLALSIDLSCGKQCNSQQIQTAPRYLTTGTNLVSTDGVSHITTVHGELKILKTSVEMLQLS